MKFYYHKIHEFLTNSMMKGTCQLKSYTLTKISFNICEEGCHKLFDSKCHCHNVDVVNSIKQVKARKNHTSSM